MKCAGFAFYRSLFKSRTELVVENLALRQQLSVLKTKKKRPKLSWPDRAFWSFLSRFWSNWCKALVIVQPATVIGWHRKLITRMTRENPTWGAPRIQKEMALLGFEVSEATVYRYRDRSTKPPSQTWRTFLKNHMHETVAIDFFTVPTVTFNALYYNGTRCHESLNGNAPFPREKESGRGRVESISYLGGLHLRYTRLAA